MTDDMKDMKIAELPSAEDGLVEVGYTLSPPRVWIGVSITFGEYAQSLTGKYGSIMVKGGYSIPVDDPNGVQELQEALIAQSESFLKEFYNKAADALRDLHNGMRRGREG